MSNGDKQWRADEPLPGDEIAPTKYRKLPVEIQAIRWSGRNLKQVIDFTGLHPSAEKWTWDEYEEVVRTQGFKIFSLEASYIVPVGHYIIRGVKGEFYACEPSIFGLTYERATTPRSATPRSDLIERAALLLESAADVGIDAQYIDGTKTPNSKLCADTAKALRSALSHELPIHDLYKDGDAHLPAAILDRNGEVVLRLCKKCGKGEAELVEPCLAAHERPLEHISTREIDQLVAERDAQPSSKEPQTKLRIVTGRLVDAKYEDVCDQQYVAAEDALELERENLELTLALGHPPAPSATRRSDEAFALDEVCKASGYQRWWTNSGKLFFERDGEPGRIQVLGITYLTPARDKEK